MQTDWLPFALRYLEQWIGFRMRLSDQPGCAVAVARDGELVFERAFGMADLAGGLPLTPRHRFRVASHSKTFTASAIMLLRERGQLRLDDPAGRHVEGLPEALATATLAQLLSHAAGLSRDGADSGHWNERQPFPDEAGLRADLARPLVLEPGERLKYSNLGFGLLGLVVARVTGEPFGAWVAREVVAAAGLAETVPDLPGDNAAPLAMGHGGTVPVGRHAIPGHNPTHALASATGFVSTAGDLARFFGRLAPAASASILSAASRREMARPQWRVPHTEAARHYGLGTICGAVDGHAHFGHSGSFQGFQSRTCVVPDWNVAVSLVFNAIDGPAGPWMDGALHILGCFAGKGAPEPAVADWTGRWWSLWGAVDLVPMGGRVLLGSPALLTPFTDASELEVLSATHGRIALANGFGSHGEPAERIPGAGGEPVALRLGGAKLLPEPALVAEITARMAP